MTNKKIKILSVVGARPNFMKIAPIHFAFKKYKNVEHIIVHTGQHYDKNMSKIFFDDLELPKPNEYLNVGSASHAEQTAKIMVEFEKILLKHKPNLVIVVGDVNSTVACSLVTVKFGIPVAHVEAGLRSFDRKMPEEINRIVTDSISDYLFVTEKSGIQNLISEGKKKNQIFFVGNVMIDSLLNFVKKADKSAILSDLKIESKNYCLVTLHRPSNVDKKDFLNKIGKLFSTISKDLNIVFPIHPRTKKMIKSFGLENYFKNVILTEPLGYLDFLKLMKNSKFVLTDSGGIQEETTFLKIPCLTLRENTERPITIENGTNKLCGNDFNKIKNEIHKIKNTQKMKSRVPKLWDGKSAERIAKICYEKIII